MNMKGFDVIGNDIYFEGYKVGVLTVAEGTVKDTITYMLERMNDSDVEHHYLNQATFKNERHNDT
jgi:hypothetical protein